MRARNDKAEWRALSIRQPWASLIVLGLKDVENRTWSTRWRGPLLIHASKTPEPNADTMGLLSPREIVSLPVGGIVGMVQLIDCVPKAHGPWYSGPIGWRLANAQPLAFVPIVGRLGLFRVPAEIIARLDIHRGFAPTTR